MGISKTKYKQGDRIVCIGDVDNLYITTGVTGTYIGPSGHYDHIIEFDKDVDGNGAGERHGVSLKSGYWLHVEDVDIRPLKKPVPFTDKELEEIFI